MAAFMARTCLKQRRILCDVMRKDPNGIGRVVAFDKLCVECRSYRTTPTYLKRRKTAEERKQKILLSFAPKSTKEKGTKAVDIWKDMSVAELAESCGRSVDEVLESISYSDSARYYENTVFADRYVLHDAVRRLGLKFRIVPKPSRGSSTEEDRDALKRPPPQPGRTVKRHPVVTVMGHVDHGKTTLLDALRKTSVVESEFGGITQHIGAFNVTLESGEKMTFLDTPGHAAFTAMRERGANVTDIVVLVVAADDGVMEQTVESIRMAKEANVPIIVAINKIDKPNADIERTRRMLSEQGIQVEDIGGEVQSVNVSALHGTNLRELVETVATQAELMDLRGDPSGLVEGVVIESSTDTGRGKLATVLVQRGTLGKGAILVSGLAWAKVRSMFDHAGQPLPEVKLSEAAQVIGWRESPAVGDEILEVENERRAHAVLRYRRAKTADSKALQQAEIIAEKRAEYQEYRARLEEKRKLGRYRRKLGGPRPKETQPDDGIPRLNVLVKADVAGSVEAILNIFDTYGDDDRCRLNVIHYGVGPLTESEVDMAKAFDAIVYCFNVEPTTKASQRAEQEALVVRTHKIIYKLVDDVKEEIVKKLPPNIAEEILGKANVLQLFVVTEGKTKWNVAGCRCTEGTLKKFQMFRLKRENRIIYEGKLASMRHLKNEVDSIKNGVECGLRFEDPDVSVQPGDVLICYGTYETEPRTNWDPGF